MHKTYSGYWRHFALLIIFVSAFSNQRTEAQPSPIFVYGAEPIHVPSEMPPVIRIWRPTNLLQESGIKHGPPFQAALVRVFNEDTQWTSEVAVFRFPGGVVRAWKSRSFSPEDRAVMSDMKAKSPVPSVDPRTWVTKLDDQTRKLIDDKTLKTYETRHFVFIWGKDPTEVVRKSLNSPQFIEKAGEWFEKVWTAYEVDFQAPMPYVRDPGPQRIIVKLYGTGIPGLWHGWANSAKEMALDPRGMLYGSTVVSHEFSHVVDAYTGGFMIRPSVGPWWETHAENASFNFTPTHNDKLSDMFSHLTHGIQWPDSRYSNWAILMHLWEKKRTQHLVFGVWSQNLRDQRGASLEDPIETTVRIGQADGSLPNGWESWNEEIGEMGARLVTMDYINQGYLSDATVGIREGTLSEVTPDENDPGWFKAPSDKKLYAYGVQWIPVTPDPGQKMLSVAFRGRSKDSAAQWRLTIVSVAKDDVVRYSPRVTAIGENETKVEMQVRPGEEYVLAVAATPTKYQTLTWGQIPDFDYPYVLRALGATFQKALDARTVDE
jgi:hypothetical protein